MEAMFYLASLVAETLAVVEQDKSDDIFITTYIYIYIYREMHA
jgi:hypothetical protein